MTACDGSTELAFPWPKSSFDAPFPKRNKRLTEVLGKQLLIGKGNDTLDLRIRSTNQDNLITQAETGDTVFYGKVCQFRGLYYFSQALSDTFYWIYAVKITDQLIYGLNTSWEQTLLIDQVIEQGTYPRLVKWMNPENIRLHPHKKEMKSMLSDILKQIPPDTILTITREEQAHQSQDTTPFDPDEYELITKLYPNPVQDFCHVELGDQPNLHYFLSDGQGNTVAQGQFRDKKNHMDLRKLNRGLYVLTLHSVVDQHKEIIKIMKH